MTPPPAALPTLALKARLRWDAKNRQYALVYPERALLLNPVAAFIVQRCDGTSSIEAIARAIRTEFEEAPDDTESVVRKLLGELSARGLVVGVDAVPDASFAKAAALAPRPFTLICELTYLCPLKCAYCSNPVDLRQRELGTDHWLRVLSEASELGVLQVHFTGGEPLLRNDVEVLAAHARSLGLYTNLITSGLPRDDARLERICKAGIDNVQVSIQDTDEDGATAIAAKHALVDKLETARLVKKLGLPLTLNVVLHARNITRTAQFLELGKELRADRIELANTQYLGWAGLNREALLPTREELERAFVLAQEAKRELLGRAEVLFVKPDHFGTYPRACMDGWGQRFLHLAPNGDILPCHAAKSITTLTFPNATTSTLASAWNDSEAFQAYRGSAWMKEPCASCDRKDVDFGGCRCQAFAMTGDAHRTDPACTLAPDHHVHVGRLAKLRRQDGPPKLLVLRHPTRTKKPTPDAP